jgi:hypothetical protein
MAGIALLGNRTLGAAATGRRTSTVGEPSAASAGRQVLITGNWYASSSIDGGASFSAINPYTRLQPPAATQFCCDQVVAHDKRRGIWLWVLQYSRDANGTNVFRLAVTSDADFPDGWHFWEVAPADVNRAWANLWFDYPDLALSADHAYVSFNRFKDKAHQGAVVMRFPLDALAAGGAPSMQSWPTDTFGSLRLTLGAGRTMYWGSNANSRRLVLFAWPDREAQVSQWDFDVSPSNPQISSVAPNGVDWLSRADLRITGASIAGGTITFMWTSGDDARHPHPYCRVVQIDEATKRLAGEPDIWSRTHAWAYPAAAANGAGTLGFTAFYGGGDQNPSHVVGARFGSQWKAVYSKRGGDSPVEAKWGDYLTCVPDGPAGDSWVASGYTLEGGETEDFIVPRVVQFRATA